ncbi:uroporphyrinogen-III synthase [Thalassotalea euphylliae]|uniref:Uroporphyrinogen-III synthase n=1 Tax=Thalassotalea euphylliae TaxID=1655234 RepID=A0A3E0U3P9_9GAMM|nr:uroporphyrinogen-III synthase [Thalassotalea euphylliae]REL31360.1 uroporphyrinogen-III synthase [Thalassotalea euphylliae]
MATNIVNKSHLQASNSRKSSKPKLLITRPEPQAQQLASQLNLAGYQTLCQPMFAYSAAGNQSQLSQTLETHLPDITIFISKAAVEWANQILPLSTWPTATTAITVAVGSATLTALRQLGIKQAICPPQHDSEGMLALSELSQVTNKNILIVRGNGGRELLANELVIRGANVRYFESYYRQWHEFDPHQAQQWRSQGVTGIIVTSQALLESTWQLTQNGTHSEHNNNFWQNTCLWFVASTRIAQLAREYGLKHVICTHGASAQAIITTLNQLESINDN